MHEQTLSQLNLSPEQAAIYETLLAAGPQTASKLVNRLPYKRTAVYYHLDRLAELGIINKEERDGKATRFTPNHPVKLVDLAETNVRRAQDAQRSVQAILPTLITEFNQISGQPGIQYYDGKDGVEKVIFATLEAQGEILQYVDVEAVEKYIPEIQKKYAAKRHTLNKKKKVIVTGSEFNKQFFQTLGDRAVDTRYITYNMQNFESIMYIYDDVIAYVVLNPAHMMGIIIQNPHLAQLHTQLFHHTWSIAKIAV